MKKAMIGVCIIALFAFNEKNKLVGRWETKPSPDGNVTSVLMKDDNSFEGFINRKPFVTGQYTFVDDVFSFTDNGCDGAKADYKVIFFSNSDSIRFELINDTCTRRRNGMTRLVLGRVK
jgi:hypothetical protein